MSPPKLPQPPLVCLHHKLLKLQNLEFKKWKHQDRLISSWLLGSMSEDILNQMLIANSQRIYGPIFMKFILHDVLGDVIQE